MTIDQWVEVTRTLGVAAPLVIILLYLLRQATTERRTITDRFLAALEAFTTESTDARLRAAEALNEFTAALRENDRRNSDEHSRMIAALDRFGGRR